MPEPVMSPSRKGVVGHRISDPSIVAVRRTGHLMVDPASLFCQLATQLALADLVAVGDALVLAPRYPDPYDDRPFVGLTN